MNLGLQNANGISLAAETTDASGPKGQVPSLRVWILRVQTDPFKNMHSRQEYQPVRISIYKISYYQMGSVQFSSVAQSCLTLCNPMNRSSQASLSITNSRSLLKLMPIKSVMPSSHRILCHPLLLLPPNPPSIGVFSNESTPRMRWPKYWSFSFSISPSNEHPGLISFRMAWLDLLAVQGTLKSLLQHHSSKASIFQCSAFFMVQLTSIHDHWKNLTRRTFFGKVMSLLFNMLSRLVITFLPRSKCLLISWLQSPSAVILELKKIKSDTASTISS